MNKIYSYFQFCFALFLSSFFVYKQYNKNAKMEEINITHFVNPHLFWFKIENLKSKKEEINRLERKLQNLAPQYRKATHQSYNCGDLLALHFIPWDKYVRASVAEVWQSGKTCKYIVWLLDHGFPVFTAEKDLVPLPSEFHCRIGNIQRGGIANILPIEKDRDFKNQRIAEWTERAYREMSRLLSESFSISMDIKNKMKKHVWCDLRIESNNGQICKASNFLQLHNLGEIIKYDEFQKLCVDLKTLKQIPWEKFNKSSNYVRNETLQSQYYEEVQKALNPQNFEVSQASQLKVSDWLERNFDSVITVSECDNKASELVVDELNNDMQKLFAPPSWYNPVNVINKFLLKMPPMPDFRAFDMSEEEAVIIESIKKEDNKLVASKLDVKEAFTSKPTNKSVEDYASSIAPKSINIKYPFTSCNNLDKKHESYVSPFDDEDLQPKLSTLAQQKKNFLPAGYDVTQLVKYRNPNHWHRVRDIKKSSIVPNQLITDHDKGLKQSNEDFNNDQNLLQHQETKKDHESNKKPGKASVAMFVPKKQEQKQHWCELTSKLTKVNLCDNSDWSDFYVQLASPENVSKYDELIEYLYMQRDQFIPVHESKLILGANYVVKYQDFYYRAILQNTWGTKEMTVFSFFFVDNAFVYEVVSDDNIRDDTFQSSRQIINFMPFQAIHCSLVGLDKNSCKQIKFNVDANAKLYAFACIMGKNYMNNLEINSYKIVLFECEDDDAGDALNEDALPNSGISLNTAFIKTKLAECDETTLFYLDKDFGLHEKPITRSIAQRLLASQQSY